MKKPSIIIYIFLLFVTCEAFANGLNNLEELSFRKSAANTLVCADTASFAGDQKKLSQIYNRVLSKINTRVCSNNHVADVASCVLDMGLSSGWEKLSSECNSIFSKVEKKEAIECLETTMAYSEKYLKPITDSELKRIYTLGRLSGQDKKTTAKVFYAENCPY